MYDNDTVLVGITRARPHCLECIGAAARFSEVGGRIVSLLAHDVVLYREQV